MLNNLPEGGGIKIFFLNFIPVPILFIITSSKYLKKIFFTVSGAIQFCTYKENYVLTCNSCLFSLISQKMKIKMEFHKNDRKCTAWLLSR